MSSDNSYCNPEGINDYKIGYGNSFLNIFMIILSCLSISLNLIFAILYIKKIRADKYTISSIEKLLCIISITETLISVCWLINSLAMSTPDGRKRNCTGCRILGHFEIFLYLFDWIILSSSLYQIKQMIINPLKLLNKDFHIRKYVLIGLTSCVVIGFISLFLQLEGISPMLSCFIDIFHIKNYNSKYIILRNILFWFFFSTPIILFGFGFYQVYLMMKSFKYQNDINNRIFFKNYSYYIFTYIIMAFLLITIYVITYIEGEKTPRKWLQIYISIITVLSCSTPLIVGIIRCFKTNLLCGDILCCTKVDKLPEILIEKKENKSKLKTSFIGFEEELLKKLITKHYIGVSFALGKAKYIEMKEDIDEVIMSNMQKNSWHSQILSKDSLADNEENNRDSNLHVDEINNENNNENNNYTVNVNSIDYDEEIKILKSDTDYNITHSEILKDLDLDLNDDFIVLEDRNININIKEYCTRFFKLLRKIEGVSEDDIIKFIRPKNISDNKDNLIKRITGSNFYINSTNKEYILKTISKEEVIFYKNYMITELYTYLKQNKNSLLCRNFGIYKFLSENDKYNYIAVMQNSYESLIEKENFEIEENTSSDKRKKAQKKNNFVVKKIKQNELDNSIIIDSITNPKSSLNFSVDFGLKKHFNSFKVYLGENEYKRLKNLIKKDRKFLLSLGVRNFNFLVVEKKIKRNKDEKDIDDNLILENYGENNTKDIINSNNKNSDYFQEYNLNILKNMRKYLFKSNQCNKIYSICIIDYFKNHDEFKI